MGLLVDGNWQDQWYQNKKGEFSRQDARFRNWVTADGEPALTGEGGFKADSGRYHLYVSLACPWAHRTLIFRKLKQLQAHIGVTVVDAKMLDQGWFFSEISQHNPLQDLRYLHQVYTAAVRDYTGRVTVPVLWDKQQQTIVSNESSEIIRMFNTAFNLITGNTDDYYPDQLREEIDTINDLVYENINNGVYRAGFATTQEAYNIAYSRLFDALDHIEQILSRSRYLVGDTITEADWRLFTTLIRFDSVYYGHFKTNKQQIEDYANLSNYVRELYQYEGIAESVDLLHIKTHYYYSHTSINPTQIVPNGPGIDYGRAHNRGELFALESQRKSA
ncbi:MAG: putative glutathione S-transferase [Parasphingorhabdus sp.]|jgi:putative glutathione S-transferase